MTAKKDATKTIGLLGCGTIGGYIAARAAELGFCRVAYVYDGDPDRAAAVEGAQAVTDAAAVASRDVDLVVETATADVVRGLALDVLSRSDMLIFSVTSLADDAFRESVRERCRLSGTRLYVPHGAILGLDGIFDGRSVIDEVTITTTKNPRNLGLTEPAEGTLYDGPTRFRGT